MTTFKNNKKNKHLINQQIRNSEVRLVGENVTQGIYSTREALKIANDLDLDLILLSDKSDPPICKIIDYKKFVYDTEKKASKQSKSAQLKEIKLSPNIGEHDIDFKSKNAIRFLEDGSKLKLTLEFKGREMAHQEQGQLTLLKFIARLETYGVAENLPKLDGKKMIVFIKPTK